ncbi:MAG: UBP-type zinc finger domain-containing protein [Thermoproteota archaeon]|nr:UBP-type zinc finger domain-containing protein [Thermoproteota archaeon]
MKATENVSPKTLACKEYIKEGTKWVALRMCLSCGHVCCCDSSPGRHATRHYSDTDHPVMVALPNMAWKWC